VLLCAALSSVHSLDERGEIRTPDAKSSLGDAKSSLSDAKSSLGDVKSSLGDAESSLGDAKSSLGDAKSSLSDAKSSLGDAKSSAGVVALDPRLFRPTPALSFPGALQYTHPRARTSQSPHL
jgi:hypothetical protein